LPADFSPAASAQGGAVATRQSLGLPPLRGRQPAGTKPLLMRWERSHIRSLYPFLRQARWDTSGPQAPGGFPRLLRARATTERPRESPVLEPGHRVRRRTVQVGLSAAGSPVRAAGTVSP